MGGAAVQTHEFGRWLSSPKEVRTVCSSRSLSPSAGPEQSARRGRHIAAVSAGI